MEIQYSYCFGFPEFVEEVVAKFVFSHFELLLGEAVRSLNWDVEAVLLSPQ